MGGVIVGDPLLRSFIQHHADVMTAVGEDYAGLPVGDDAAADFGRHLIVLPNVCAVVAHGFLRSGAALRDRMRRDDGFIGEGYSSGSNFTKGFRDGHS